MAERDISEIKKNDNPCKEFISSWLETTIFEKNPGLATNTKRVCITKNANIKHTVDKLQGLLESTEGFVCLEAHGPHLQKMLSILEITKKVIKEKDTSTTIHQWNRMLSFQSIQPGRNELLERKINIPILICFISTSSDLANDLPFSLFTEQT
ncbi:hypothetical protein NCAS_0A02010 [Naumovozyma castellii]|uniref:DNA/RNA-binding protein Alba-like domain-containing protein n=1 Tax=Naumovozyma castellii TaxID=27288 RepID=G0V5M1_NAUCA|nr:hypothetical protein NCAS_0A02010 [Naumovozyma castellii CBS 4309]CCC66759.1 hypothetical protein NCAS_0A02010 [Naumovozyma castellii CBS 4309]